MLSKTGAFASFTPKAPKKEIDPSAEIEKQFAGLRQSSQARKGEALRRQELDLARNANISGGFGGAEQKMRDEARLDLERQFGAQEAELGAQEAAAKIQESMFSREFDENQKTNMVNALTALKSSGMLENAPAAQDRLKNFLERFSGSYGDRALPVAAPGQTNPRGVFNSKENRFRSQ